jgi:molybdenum cofactor biosynthesis enzyme MoaA
MVDGLYLRANGELPCWCGPGEAIVHTRLELGRVPEQPQNLAPIRSVRRAFAEGRLPFPGTCEGCQVLGTRPARELGPRRTRLDELHVEPSWLCNLGCAMCPPDNGARRALREHEHLDPALLIELLDALLAGGVQQLRTVRFEGKGDPCLHPRLEELVQATRQRYPRSFLVLTTNGSFPIRPDLAHCGLDHVDISADGFTPSSYSRYRVRGNLKRVKSFAEDLASRGVQVGWKYILMPWNDGEDELLACLAWCRARDIQLELRLTHSAEASQDWDWERLQAWVARHEGAIARRTLASAASEARP